MSTYRGPVVPQPVLTETGDYHSRSDERHAFFFLLLCGHRYVCKTRKNDRGWVVGVPGKAEILPCDECRLALEKAGKPIPPCWHCKGAGEILTKTIQGRSISIAVVKCPACKGRTTPGAPKPDLGEAMGLGKRGT